MDLGLTVRAIEASTLLKSDPARSLALAIVLHAGTEPALSMRPLPLEAAIGFCCVEEAIGFFRQYGWDHLALEHKGGKSTIRFDQRPVRLRRPFTVH